MVCPMNLLSAISITEILGFIVIVLLAWQIWTFLRTPSNLPPGPRGWPIVGFLPYLQEKTHVQFNEMAKTYGDVFSFYAGNKLMIILNSYDAIKEALIKQGDNFAGRASKESLAENEIPGIFVAEGEIWKDYKRFTLTALRDFGFGKQSLEPRIHEEVQFLIDEIKNEAGSAIDVGNLLRMSVSNVICTIKFGERFDYKDKDFLYLIHILENHLNRAVPMDYILFFPKLMKIPGVRWYFAKKTFRMTAALLKEYIRKKIKATSQTYEEGNVNNFITAWFTEAAKRGEERGKNFTNENLANVILSLFVAGTDTTANTIRWSILYLMKHPEIQAKLHKEIDEIIGHDRMPSTTDRDRMPYTEATLMEISRISSLVPLALMHVNSEATTLKNYHIPKRSYVFPNLWAVHRDPTIYPEPEEFRPERFLDSNGKVIKTEKLIPFSLGKRQCLGEGLARMELFIYFTSLLQTFKFTKPENAKLSFDYSMGTVSIPKPFKTIPNLRNK